MTWSFAKPPSARAVREWGVRGVSACCSSGKADVRFVRGLGRGISRKREQTDIRDTSWSMLGISDIVHGWIPESFRSTAFGSHWNKAMDGRKLSQHPIVKGPGILSYVKRNKCTCRNVWGKRGRGKEAGAGGKQRCLKSDLGLCGTVPFHSIRMACVTLTGSELASMAKSTIIPLV